MTRCPACSSLLYRRVVAGVTLDGCPACGGAFADKGELQKLSKDPVGLRMVDDAFPKGLQPPAGGRTGACPRCGGSLCELELTSMRGVRLDRCKDCEGVWLDHGEATGIADRLLAARGGAPAAASEPLRTELVPPSEKPSASVVARFGPPASGRPPAGARAAAFAGTGAAAQPARAAAAAAASGDRTSTAALPIVRGVAAGHLDRSPGFMASLERGLRFIRGAYSLALECPRLLLPLAVGAVAQLLLGGAVLAYLLVSARQGGRVEPEFLKNAGPLLAGLGIFFVFVAQLGNMAILGMTVNMVDAHLKGLEPDFSVAARDVLKNAGGVVAMAVVSTLVSILTSRDNRGRRGILASLIDQAWTVLSYLLMPIIIVEDVGLMSALRRAKELHARGLLQIAVGEVGLRAIAGISGVLIVGAAMLLGFLLFPTAGLGAIIAVASVAVLLLVALGVLHAFARGAYYTCLYLWAVEVERAGDPARALVPAPLAAALTS